MRERADYGNWVSKRLVFIPSLFGLAFLALSLLNWVLLIPAALLLLLSAYFLYVRYQFSPEGGKVQEKIWALVLDNLDWMGEGRALDIGCGNGALAIRLAQRSAKAEIIGIDYWGERWEYSKEACERNAAIEGVSDRVAFQKASAAALPFEDGYFDAVVSNFVFHEVGDAKDKRELIREALRVARKGGKFSFQDEFLLKQFYGEVDDLVKTIKSWGISEVEFIQSREAEFVPRALKVPFILGAMGIIRGEK
jgi:SAM-dependent methyltransferase